MVTSNFYSIHSADDKCYVVMASLDLSMAFDMVNTNLLIKRLRIMGMPNDIITLIREWLVGRVKDLIKLSNSIV